MSIACRKCGKPLLASGVKPVSRSQLVCPCGFRTRIGPNREAFAELGAAARGVRSARRAVDGKR